MLISPPQGCRVCTCKPCVEKVAGFVLANLALKKLQGLLPTNPAIKKSSKRLRVSLANPGTKANGSTSVPMVRTGKPLQPFHIGYREDYVSCTAHCPDTP